MDHKQNDNGRQKWNKENFANCVWILINKIIVVRSHWWNGSKATESLNYHQWEFTGLSFYFPKCSISDSS